MRTACIAALGLALVLGGSAWARAHAQVSTKDYLDAIHEACPKTYVQQPDGTKEPVAKCTRGFSLATEAPVAAPSDKAPADKHKAVRRTAAAAPARKASRLSNLLIHFKLGSDQLTPDGQANATNFAAALRDPSVMQLKFEIGGHTDVSGGAARNQQLSEARAEAVRSFLVNQGVDGARLTAKGYGSSDLADPAAPRSAANRRVEARPL
jgi:outer membrane protein OmpA-like peptidoglycan-associated protein